METFVTVITACCAPRKSYRDRLRAGIGAPVRFVLLEHGRERPSADEVALVLNSSVDQPILFNQSLSWIYSS
ncbi:hypothetical protein [Sphingobium sp. HWE2-09]|uniref:hypothetical protein n=1 Tax=Sphingobium sp. HWE2-09 TaxID=3108390 RepID=UPI002DC2D852|nr:hypothetical protein [Sphingobium sp. HWE2-09]